MNKSSLFHRVRVVQVNIEQDLLKVTSLLLLSLRLVSYFWGEIKIIHIYFPVYMWELINVVFFFFLSSSWMEAWFRIYVAQNLSCFCWKHFFFEKKIFSSWFFCQFFIWSVDSTVVLLVRRSGFSVLGLNVYTR